MYAQSVEISNNTHNGIVIKDTLELVYELCKPGQVDFCSDGYEQGFRFLYSGLVQPSECWYESYSNKFFSIDINPVLDSLKRRKLNFQERETILTELSNLKGELITVDCPWLKRRIRKEDHYLKIDRKFDGKFHYKKIRVEISYICFGERNIIIPNIDCPNRKKGLISLGKSNVCYILELSGVPPQK